VYTSELAVQPDGKVVAVGYVPQTYEGEVPQLVLVRLGPDGSLDTGFGAGGVVQVDAFAQSERSPCSPMAGSWSPASQATASR
jgi:hypothetical protein